MACITKRRGRWVIDFYDQTGKRRWKTLKQGTKKKQAKDELRAIEDMVSRGVYLPARKVPTFEEVRKQWLEYKKPNLRETTYEVYEIISKYHLKELDELRVTQITPVVVEKFIATMQKKQKMVHRKGSNKEGKKTLCVFSEKKVSLETVKKVIALLHQVMAYAVRHRLIEYNPVRDAERPRSQGREDQRKQNIIMNPDQIRAFLDKVEDQKYRTLFLTAIMTGARQGEILGLKWSDINFRKKQVHINRTFNHGRFFTPKTKGSARRIDLSPMVLKDLAGWKLKSGGRDEDIVFPNEAGQPLNYSNMVQRYFLKAIRDANIPRVRFHDLRHSYASLLLSQGENIKYIQTQLGHSSPMVTLNIYSHLLKDSNQEAACRLENTIFAQSGSKMVADKEKGIMVESITP
jgi:integrase